MFAIDDKGGDKKDRACEDNNRLHFTAAVLISTHLANNGPGLQLVLIKQMKIFALTAFV